MNEEIEALKATILKQSETIDQIIRQNASMEVEISEKKSEIEKLSASLRDREADIKELTVENKRKDEINLMMAQDIKAMRIQR